MVYFETVEWLGPELADGTPVVKLGNAGRWSPYSPAAAPEDAGAGVFFGVWRGVRNGTASIEIVSEASDEGGGVSDGLDDKLLHQSPVDGASG